MRGFKELKVWQRAHQFVLDIYKITKKFPSDEKFGLTLQIRRAAISIPANIAEDFKRKSDKDFAHFINIAESSLEEVKYYLFVSSDLGYINEKVYQLLNNQTEEIGKMLNGLYKKLVRGRQ